MRLLKEYMSLEFQELWDKFLEIGTDKNHVHFLIQQIPKYSVTEMVKSITAKKIFEKHPELKKQQCKGGVWYVKNIIIKVKTEESIW